MTRRLGGEVVMDQVVTVPGDEKIYCAIVRKLGRKPEVFLLSDITKIRNRSAPLTLMRLHPQAPSARAGRR